MIAQLKNQDPIKPMDPSAVRRPARAVQLGVRHPGDARRRSARWRTSLRSTRCSTARRIIGRDVLAPATASRSHAEGVPVTRRDRRAGRRDRRCSSCYAIRPARSSRRMTMPTTRGLHGLHLGRQHRRRHARPSGAYKIEVDRQRRRQERIARTCCWPAASSSVTHRPDATGLTLNTDTLGAHRHERRRRVHVTRKQYLRSTPCHFVIALQRPERCADRPQRHCQQHRQHVRPTASRGRAPSSPSCSPCRCRA